MVKRKAEIELDEWLKLAPALARIEVARQTGVKSEVVPTPTPTAKVSPTKEEAGMLTDEVTSYNEDPSDWFWLLLEQSGHEHWCPVLPVRERSVTGIAGPHGEGGLGRLWIRPVQT